MTAPARQALRLTSSLALASPLTRSAAVAVAGSSRHASTYSPSGFEPSAGDRQRRPHSPFFFTAKGELNNQIQRLEGVLADAERALRKQHVWPLPAHLPYLQPSPTAWESSGGMNFVVRSNADYKGFVELLNKLHQLAHVAATAGVHDVAALLEATTLPFQKPSMKIERERLAAKAAAKAAGEVKGIDELGRSYAMGRRKEAHARAWIVPSAAGLAALDKPALDLGEDKTDVPVGEILINHLPLATHFNRHQDRELVLRPFRLAGLLGAYNVFALVRGGGNSGQAGAVAMAVARALAQIRPDAHGPLHNDRLLSRDPRMVERKHTGKAKARKRYTWVKR
ncbi:30S ribosomal protein S9 [Vanrija pseudolonga]|uniref:30S ribosomal protein S9 n=1 Tax=Vanrija pseudolonga TaxID=143232 RepID=A0AAF0Y0X4_9TREE|nr:30S ribosomal protein S9 [Vanrija pseudolonga]